MFKYTCDKKNIFKKKACNKFSSMLQTFRCLNVVAILKEAKAPPPKKKKTLKWETETSQHLLA